MEHVLFNYVKSERTLLSFFFSSVGVVWVCGCKAFIPVAELKASLFKLHLVNQVFCLLCLVEGSHLKVASCLLSPAIQLVVGISNPSWVSLPFFVCSCVGLVDWSLTSNFLGLFR